MNRDLSGITVGFALTGSFCTMKRAVEQIGILQELGAKVLPVLSHSVVSTDTRFGTADYWTEQICRAAGTDHLITTMTEAEPIGPQQLCDILIIAPCTGNTMAKLCCGITDTAVTMAAKAHLRNGRPLVLAISTNDGLAGNAKTLGMLLAAKNIYFVPFGQDAPQNKPNFLIAVMEQIPETLKEALNGRQIQPILACNSSSFDV